jgi:hypothetical protein
MSAEFGSSVAMDTLNIRIKTLDTCFNKLEGKLDPESQQLSFDISNQQYVLMKEYQYRKEVETASKSLDSIESDKDLQKYKKACEKFKGFKSQSQWNDLQRDEKDSLLKHADSNRKPMDPDKLIADAKKKRDEADKKIKQAIAAYEKLKKDKTEMYGRGFGGNDEVGNPTAQCPLMNQTQATPNSQGTQNAKIILPKEETVNLPRKKSRVQFPNLSPCISSVTMETVNKFGNAGQWISQYGIANNLEYFGTFYVLTITNKCSSLSIMATKKDGSEEVLNAGSGVSKIYSFNNPWVEWYEK